MAIDNAQPRHADHLPRGRHLDASRDAAIRATALKLLGEIGYDRLTVDKIAASAGAGKATIYRRWSGKAELVVDALTCEKIAASTPDTGTLEGDLNALACRASELDSQSDLSVMVGLVSALPHDEELREVFRERLVEPHVTTLSVIFHRAEARGEIEPVQDLGTVTSILPALVMHRLLVTGTLPDQAFIEDIIRGVILPLVSPKTPQQAPW